METITIKPAEVLVVKVTPVVSGGGIIEGGGGASDIGDLTSVSISNPENGDVLVYNGGSWVNTSGIATESYVDTQVSDIQSQVTSNDADISSLQASVSANTSSITSLESADTTLQSDIDAEESARIASDSNLQNQIDAEVTARTNADSTLQNDINIESTAREAADLGLTELINTETSVRETAISGLQTTLASEVNRALAAEGALQDSIDAEASTRASADTTLQNNIASEASTRANADITLQNNIDTEASTRQSADTTLQNNIDALSLNSLTDVDLSTSPSDNQVLTYDSSSSSWKAEDAQVSSGTATDLSATYTATNVTIESSTGTDVTLSAATSTSAGVMSAADKSTIDNLASVATTGNYSELSGVPTLLSDFTNDTGYITGYTVTQGDVTQYQAVLSIASSQVTGLAAVATTGTVESLSNTNISTLSDGQALVWDNANSQWVNGDVASSSGLTAVSDDTSPSLGGDLTAGYDINVNNQKVVRFGGSTSTLPTIGVDMSNGKFDLLSNTSNYDININASTGDVNLTGTNINLSGSVSSGNLISTNTLSTGTLTAASLSVTNDITVSGTVDGRDVATDGAKLDTLNFGVDVNASIPPEGNADNYAIGWDSSSGEWVSKIPLLPSLNYIETVNTGTTNDGAILKYNGNIGKWEASTNNDGVVIGDISDALTALNNIEGLLKYDATNTKLYNTTNDTTKGYLDLGETNSFFGINNTGFNVDKNSPGSITLSVDTGATTPETNFDAFVISGTTTANTATTTIKEGNTLKFDIGANSATLTPSTLTADVDINLPSSSGTLALTSDITDTFLVNETSPALGADLNAGAHDINFDTGSAVNFVTDSTQSRIDFYSDTSTLRILSGHPIGNTNLSLYCGASGDVNIGPLGDQIVVNASSLDLQSKDLLFGNGSYDVTLQAPSLAANATVTLPSSTGTLALTSDVPSSINDLTDTPVSLGTAGQVLAVDSAGTATEWVTPSGGAGATYFTVVSVTATSYTLVLSDAFSYIVADNGSAITITVPPQTSVAWPDDTEIIIEQRGAGTVGVAAGSGVTIYSSQTLNSAGQYAVVGLKRTASDVWVLTGEREVSA